MSAVIEQYREGMLRARWDAATRTYSEFDEQGTETLSRPYTPEENVYADAIAAQELEDANRQSIEVALADNLAALQVLIDTPKADINTSPADHIKLLARTQRRVIRLLTRRLEGTA